MRSGSCSHRRRGLADAVKNADHLRSDLVVDAMSKA